MSHVMQFNVGESIPLHARIVTVADAYDAMRSDRIYRKGLSPERIHEELVTGKGRQFDPVLLDAFLEMEEAGILDDVTTNANEQLKQAAELGLFEEASAWLAHTS